MDAEHDAFNSINISGRDLNGFRFEGRRFWDHQDAKIGTATVCGFPDLTVAYLPLSTIWGDDSQIVVDDEPNKIYPTSTHAFVKVAGDGTEVILPISEIVGSRR